ncbi:hypothetical protein [Amycolatopsis sp. NPDC003861]
MSVAWWALAVAVCSLLVACGTLAWNILSFHKAGVAVSVKFSASYDGMRGVERFEQEVRFDVSVHNVGRLPVDVFNPGIVLNCRPGRAGLWTGIPVEGEKVRLEVGSEARFSITLDDVCHSHVTSWLPEIHSSKDVNSFYAEIDLGNGRTVRSNAIPQYKLPKDVFGEF